MKRFTLLFVFVVAGFSANAQNFTHTNSGVIKDTEDNQQQSGPAKSDPVVKVVYADPHSMEYITMDMQEDKIFFSNLPDMAITMHITDGNGNELFARKLSRKNNFADIKRLKKGLHFVTLLSDNTGSRKSFTLNRN